MLKPKMIEAINRQLNAEFYSAYLYLSMSAYFESEGLKGFAGWMRTQAMEETVHAMKFYRYLADQGAPIKMVEIAGPPTKWMSALDVFENTFRHEQKVTGLIKDLVSLARTIEDNITERFLGWYVKEQVEEEESAEKGVKKIKSASDIKVLDQEMGQRAFTPPKSI